MPQSNKLLRNVLLCFRAKNRGDAITAYNIINSKHQCIQLSLRMWKCDDSFYRQRSTVYFHCYHITIIFYCCCCYCRFFYVRLFMRKEIFFFSNRSCMWFALFSHNTPTPNSMMLIIMWMFEIKFTLLTLLNAFDTNELTVEFDIFLNEKITNWKTFAQCFDMYWMNKGHDMFIIFNLINHFGDDNINRNGIEEQDTNVTCFHSIKFFKTLTCIRKNTS